jgi:hypothetical protein
LDNIEKDKQFERENLEKQKRFESNERADALLARIKEASPEEKKAHLERQLDMTPHSADDFTEKRDLQLSDKSEENRAAEKIRLEGPFSADELTEARNFRASEVNETEKRHTENYNEYYQLFCENKIELDAPVQEKIDGRDIVPKDAVRSNQDNNEFWNHRTNKFGDYKEFAEKLPHVQEQLEQGKSIEEIKQDKELGTAAKFWYHEKRMEAIEYKDSLIVDNSGFHRAELARMYELEDVPAEVKRARVKG